VAADAGARRTATARGSALAMSLDAEPGALTAQPEGDVTPSASKTRRAVTGNRLRDGKPVFFVGDGRWSDAIDEAVHVSPEAAERLLAEAQQGHPHPVVAPYLFDLTIANGQLQPVSLRERIRAFGPSIGLRR
jgi:Protein of unknown function (DUF2849)